MCVRSTTFSVLINGELVDYFDGKRGLRQGDPISSLLFTIVMEYLSRLLGRLNGKTCYYHHPKCHKIGLKHIMFADDLILFSSGRMSSILAIKSVMETFLKVSGLDINLQKSQFFISGMSEAKKMWVESTLGTTICPLPVRYLGISMNSKEFVFCLRRLSKQLIPYVRDFYGRVVAKGGVAIWSAGKMFAKKKLKVGWALKI
ncbi:hypothetical protein QQ045_013426 [Rhodiola kirilowii]